MYGVHQIEREDSQFRETGTHIRQTDDQTNTVIQALEPIRYSVKPWNWLLPVSRSQAADMMVASLRGLGNGLGNG